MKPDSTTPGFVYVKDAVRHAMCRRIEREFDLPKHTIEINRVKMRIRDVERLLDTPIDNTQEIEIGKELSV